MWEQLKRIIKPRGAIVLFGSQPFTSALIMSNVEWFKYCWVWDKKQAGNPLIAKHSPLKTYEDIIIFGRGGTNYYPIMSVGETRRKGGQKLGSDITSDFAVGYSVYNNTYFPIAIITMSNANRNNRQHPTQKPVKLMEYLIKTYTLEGETVLDFTMGSGSTGVACKNTGRNFIGIEQDAGYIEVARKRIDAAVRQLELF